MHWANGLLRPRAGWFGRQFLRGPQVLERFVSHFTKPLDAKGRVSIPATFRAILARDGFEGLYIHPSLSAQALDCGGNALLSEIHGLIETFSPYSEERDTYALALEGSSEILKVDPEGRVTLSETAKHFAGIGSEATFVGLGHKFQIWEPELFRAHLEAARISVRDLRKELSSRHPESRTAEGTGRRPPPPPPPHSKGARE